ncbi:hypothetical protein ACXX9E_29370 [Pseudomonas sp. GNP014]
MPHAIWNTMRFGWVWQQDDLLVAAADFDVMVAPLGHAVATQ